MLLRGLQFAGPQCPNAERRIEAAAIMKNRALSFKKALNYLLHVPGSSLKKMYISGGRREYFAVPNGGMVAEKDALAIIARPEIGVFEDGLFPGNPQSWRRR